MLSEWQQLLDKLVAHHSMGWFWGWNTDENKVHPGLGLSAGGAAEVSPVREHWEQMPSATHQAP